MKTKLSSEELSKVLMDKIVVTEKEEFMIIDIDQTYSGVYKIIDSKLYKLDYIEGIYKKSDELFSLVTHFQDFETVPRPSEYQKKKLIMDLKKTDL